MEATIEFTCDWSSDDGNDQHGRIIVATPTGQIDASWRCEGGKGRGAVVESNTTSEYDYTEAHEIVNAAEICQIEGKYTGTITLAGKNGWFGLSNVTRL
jgi:hypothetical protein